MGISGGTSRCPRAEHWITFAVHVESWKHEHPSGHCIRQSQAKKSQHIQSAKQCAWYGHKNSVLFTCMIERVFSWGGRLFSWHWTASKSMTRGWVPRWAIWLIFCSHSISQSQNHGLWPKKNWGNFPDVTLAPEIENGRCEWLADRKREKRQNRVDCCK